MQIDLKSGKIFVRLLMPDGSARDYHGMYAFYDQNDRVVVRAYGDDPKSEPRAVFASCQGFEHFGNHAAAKASERAELHHRQEAARTHQDGPGLDLLALAKRGYNTPQKVFLSPAQADMMEAAGMGDMRQRPDTVVMDDLPGDLRSAIDTFGKDDERIGEVVSGMVPAQENPAEREYLESDTATAEESADADPKAPVLVWGEERGNYRPESGTGEDAGSVPKMLETPSGKFLTTLPPQEASEEEKQARRQAVLVDYLPLMSDPPTTSLSDANRLEPVLPNRAARRAAVHKRPRAPKGAQALAFVASLWFGAFKLRHG